MIITEEGLLVMIVRMMTTTMNEVCVMSDRRRHESSYESHQVIK